MKKNKQKQTLHLILKKEWFDAIVFGDKREEYRDLTDFWINRLLAKESYLSQSLREIPFKIRSLSTLQLQNQLSIVSDNDLGIKQKYDWQTITFQLGYAKDAPRAIFKFKGLQIKAPKKEWFPFETIEGLGLDFDIWAQNHLFFAIEIGERLG